MTAQNIPYLLLSVVLSTGRNITSKKTAVDIADKATFFFSQGLLFLSSAVLLILADPHAFNTVSGITCIYGMIYGVLLIISQWMYTISLKNGSTSVCTIIYSLGFILPTVSGALFWNEAFTVTHFFGLTAALAVILLTFKKGSREIQNTKTYLPFIFLAMLASGGLGIMQKVQQTSHATNEKSVFLIIAFSLACASSFIARLLCGGMVQSKAQNILYPVLTGICFGGANLCNTVLAGRMKSAIFFPAQNISTILLSTILGILLFKERPTKKTVCVLLFGILTVVIFSI